MEVGLAFDLALGLQTETHVALGIELAFAVAFDEANLSWSWQPSDPAISKGGNARPTTTKTTLAWAPKGVSSGDPRAAVSWG